MIPEQFDSVLQCELGLAVHHGAAGGGSQFRSWMGIMTEKNDCGPVATTLSSQCRRPGFDPWSGN